MRIIKAVKLLSCESGPLRAEVRDFERKNPGFAVGSIREPSNPDINAITEVLKQFGLPIYSFGGFFPRDSYVACGSLYVKSHDLPGFPLLTVGMGGYTLYDFFDGTRMLVSANNPQTEERLAQYTRLLVSVCPELNVVILPYHSREHMDLKSALIGSTMLTSDYFMNSECRQALQAHGFDVIQTSEPNYNLNIPIFEIDGRKIALVASFCSDSLRQFLKQNGIEVFKVGIRPSDGSASQYTFMNFMGICPTAEELDAASRRPIFDMLAGIRCATNWVDNPEILDFFGISYERIL